jgi:hypothetical protein
MKKSEAKSQDTVRLSFLLQIYAESRNNQYLLLYFFHAGSGVKSCPHVLGEPVDQCTRFASIKL